MAQINLHVPLAFEKALVRFMRLRGIRTKSEAIRLAVQEGLDRACRRSANINFGTWIGLAKRVPLNPSPRFKSDDDLWR